MRIVTYEYVYIGNSTREHRLNTTLIDISLIDWWVKEMQKNDEKADKYEIGGPGFYKTVALVFSAEIPDDKYPDIEWYSSKDEPRREPAEKE